MRSRTLAHAKLCVPGLAPRPVTVRVLRVEPNERWLTIFEEFSATRKTPDEVAHLHDELI